MHGTSIPVGVHVGKDLDVGVIDHGMFCCGSDETEDSMPLEHVQGPDGPVEPSKFHTFVASTQHAEFVEAFRYSASKRRLRA